MLEEFVEKDEKYKAYAFKICGCNELKHDLVNEMYLKLHTILKDEPSKEISDGYIYMMIKSIFLNQIRDNKEYVFDNYVFEAFDDKEELTERLKVNEALNRLPFVKREILMKTEENTLRAVSREIGCSHEYVRQQRLSALNDLKLMING